MGEAMGVLMSGGAAGKAWVTEGWWRAGDAVVFWVTCGGVKV